MSKPLIIRFNMHEGLFNVMVNFVYNNHSLACFSYSDQQAQIYKSQFLSENSLCLPCFCGDHQCSNCPRVHAPHSVQSNGDMTACISSVESFYADLTIIFLIKELGRSMSLKQTCYPVQNGATICRNMDKYRTISVAHYCVTIAQIAYMYTTHPLSYAALFLPL
jgi:hypothetical protein